LQYYYDQQRVRLAAWTQFSQLPGRCDGFGLCLSDAELGFVALEGGKWEGNNLNFIEGWSRRWNPLDPGSRRLVPAEAKADAAPGPDQIAARSGFVHEPAFFCEAWIGKGRRMWALAVGSREDLFSPSSCSGERKRTTGFDWVPDVKSYDAQRVRLREIHTRHGLLPLASLCELALEWPEEVPDHQKAQPLETILELLEKSSADKAPDQPAELVQMNYLLARVTGFWQGAGSPDANPVCSRRVAPEMLHYEFLCKEVSAEDRKTRRALFAFLAVLFASDNYYPGHAQMQPPGEPSSYEPAIAGMANQNFLTEVMVISGMAGAIFRLHPDAKHWRDRFIQGWKRQLEYHLYPESGVWEESHTYFLHVLHTVLPLLVRLRSEGDYDGFREPGLLQMLGALITMRSIPDHHLARGKRYLIPFGDHYENPEWLADICLSFAPHVKEGHPDLAARLLQLANGSDTGAEILTNEKVQGLGFFFRSTDPKAGEIVFALRAGGAWGHHHADEGEVFFQAFGRGLIVEAGFGRYLPGGLKHSAKGHSRRAPDSIQPIHHLWRWSRGFVVESKTDDPVPYVQAVIPTRLQLLPDGRIVTCEREQIQTRTILQLHPTIYLIIDQSSDDAPETTRFHLPVGEISAQSDGVMTRWPDGVVLTIRSLFATQPPVLCEHQPEGEPHLFTTEVAFKAESHREIFLVCAHGTRSMEVTPREGKFLVSLDEPLFEFLLSQDSLSIWNLKTSSYTLIPLPANGLPACKQRD